MEKIRTLILPDEFASLKVAKSTLEFIRLEGDLRDRCRLQRVLARLDSQRLNLAGFPNVLKVRAAEAKDEFPTRHSWDSYFRDAKHMNELKPGERPDTIHITGLPVKWFTEDSMTMPSESLISKIFKKWGTLRRVDVPAADSYRSRMRLGSNIHKFSYEDGIFFDAYIQYVEYMDFVRAMDALRGMKLLKKDGQNALTAVIKVDFDKTKHMSDSSVAHREFERKRLIAQDNLAAEKLRRKAEAEEKRREELKKKEEADSISRANRRQKREEKRKRKALTMFRKQEEDKVSMKIAREEQKLIRAQRQLESIRLLDELFDRIKIKVEKKEITLDEPSNVDAKKEDKKVDKTNDTGNKLSSDDDKKDKKTKKQKKKKVKKEKKKKRKRKKDKESASASDDTDAENGKKKIKSVLTKNIVRPSSSAGPTSADPAIPYPAIYPRFPQPWYYETALPMIYPALPRGMARGARFPRGRRRGFPWRGNSNPRVLRTFNPHLYNEQYYKYFAHLVGQEYHDFDSDYDRSSRSRSRKRSISRSRSRTRSGSCSRRRSRSKSRSRSRKRKGRSKSRSGSRRSRSRSRRSRSRRKSRSRSKSRSSSRGRYARRKRNGRSGSRVKVTRARSRSKSQRGRSRSSTWSMPKSPGRRSCSWSKRSDASISKEDPAKVRPEESLKGGHEGPAPALQVENITSD